MAWNYFKVIYFLLFHSFGRLFGALSAVTTDAAAAASAAAVMRRLIGA